MDIAASDLAGRDVYALMTRLIIPRPIAWVSSQSADGHVNLAPFSYFMGVGSAPPMLAVSVGSRKGQPKDTAVNVQATGQFVVNVVPRHLVRVMVQTSADYAPGVDEFEQVGVGKVASVAVAPPGVAQSPVRMECRLHQLIRLCDGRQDLLLGEVVHFHIDDAVLTDGQVDPRKVNPVARLGGTSYAALGEIFDIDRPQV